MKKKIIIISGVVVVLAIAAIITVLVVVLPLLGNGAMLASWAGTSLSHEETDDGWTITAESLDGHANRKLNFTTDNLAALHVSRSNSGGTVSLTVKQEENEKTFDINENFSGKIDLDGFEAGRLSLRLDFKKAQDLELVMGW